MLAAASALHARHASCAPAGACALGVLCGLLGPLLRAVFAGQQPLPAFILGEPYYPAAVFGGALLGAFLGRYRWTEGRLYPLLDAAGLQLLACSGVLVARYWPSLSSLGILLLSVVTAFVPGLLRDTALGDTAALADEPAYATAPLLGALLTIACLSFLLPPLAALAVGWGSGFFVRVLVIRQQQP